MSCIYGNENCDGNGVYGELLCAQCEDDIDRGNFFDFAARYDLETAMFKPEGEEGYDHFDADPDVEFFDDGDWKLAVYDDAVVWYAPTGTIVPDFVKYGQFESLNSHVSRGEFNHAFIVRVEPDWYFARIYRPGNSPFAYDVNSFGDALDFASSRGCEVIVARSVWEQ
jgi:hypothetical protein